MMFDTISAMTDVSDISVLDRYIMEISSLWHTRALILFFGKISDIYRVISDIYRDISRIYRDISYIYIFKWSDLKS